ncbi:hypothetical protein EVAR_59850_1 [Eumeta japonica]|uniref:Uncharacterized protein n=1 Tax=Eumeta variegata TaxID=151549 RepID=A0A4C1Z9L1_EUMVA|nr:hypothetical protein EVAR_59850_1 [Eumeta japonica]
MENELASHQKVSSHCRPWTLATLEEPPVRCRPLGVNEPFRFERKPITSRGTCPRLRELAACEEPVISCGRPVNIAADKALSEAAANVRSPEGRSINRPGCLYEPRTIPPAIRRSLLAPSVES